MAVAGLAAFTVILRIISSVARRMNVVRVM
jgi:hypothetical protein